MLPRNISSTHMATHTPFRPMLRDSSHASGSLTTQMLLKFIMAGTVVCPTPTMAP